MTNDLETVLRLYSKKHTNKALDFFWIGFLIYSASFALSTTTTVNYIICQLFQIIGILIFVPSAIKLIEWKFTNSYLKFLFIIYCMWQLSVIIRGFDLDYRNIKVMLFDAESGLFRFFVPLVLLFPKNLLYYKKSVKVILVLGMLFIVYDILFYKNLTNLDYENVNTKFTYEHFVKILSVSSGLILMTFPYQTNRSKYIALAVLVISVFFSILRARRALLIMSFSPLLISYILLLYTQNKKNAIIFFSILFVGFIVLFSYKNYNANTPGIFRLLSDRATSDTRSGVEMFFYRDLTTQDWIIGKGINGKYYCPDIDLGSVTDYRYMIETDYLNTILKGGIISLGLMLLIAIPAIILGLFYSKNILSKAAAIWILLWVIELYPASVSTFSMHHILMWISIGICYSTIIRRIPEKTLVKIFLTDTGK